eukprot:3007778-Prymnesium_polylepis.1
MHNTYLSSEPNPGRPAYRPARAVSGALEVTGLCVECTRPGRGVPSHVLLRRQENTARMIKSFLETIGRPHDVHSAPADPRGVRADPRRRRHRRRWRAGSCRRQRRRPSTAPPSGRRARA